MHELDRLIANWRKTIRATHGVQDDRLDELESHLREHMEKLSRSGMNDAESFHMAVAQLGSPGSISSEFQKLDEPIWMPVKVAVGVGIVATIAIALYLAAGFHRGTGLLLGSHVFAVTVGYSTLFVLGTLGICFVCQRCFVDFSSPRLRSLGRVTFIITVLAAFLTGVGIVTGMIWARTELGRWWAWDPKETAALCVLVWLIVFAAAHRVPRVSGRAIMLLSIVGNAVVSLAWFGPNLMSGLPNYGKMNLGVLTVVMCSSLVFVVVGVAPAECLRRVWSR